jgi:uncharacterized protein (DUF2141 family)
LFKVAHAVHHASRPPTAWAAMSFHPVEALTGAVVIPALVLTVPIHYGALLAVLSVMTVMGVTNHMGWEMFPDALVKGRAGRWLITASHHERHHREYRCNYGLYFRFWDRLCGTDKALGNSIARIPALALLLLALGGAAPPGADLEVRLEQLRSAKGTLRLCLTRERRHFPDCKGDPRALKQSAPAAGGAVRLAGVAPGAYALSVIHDENGNGRLDTFAGIPQGGLRLLAQPGDPLRSAELRGGRVQRGHRRQSQAVRIRYLL